MEGEARGAGIKNNIEFVIHREGPEAVQKIEKEMETAGYPIKYKELKATKFYPLAAEAILLLVIGRIFNYQDDDFKEMGRYGAKSSLITRLFMKYFVSFNKFVSKPPEMWSKYFTRGNISIKEFSEEKKCSIVRIENFNLSKHHCCLLSGFLSALLEMMIKHKVKCRETRCTFEGDDYHEFVLEW